MEETWLYALRREPPAPFKDQLRQRLRQDQPAATPWWSHRQIATLLLGVALAAALLAVPAVRASAASLLSWFRVVNFAAVPVDRNRFDVLESQGLDIKALIGEHVQVLQDPGDPVAVASVAQAGAVAGIDVRLPQWLPDGTTIIETAVAGEQAVQVTANAPRLEQVMQALGIDDLPVPAGLHGQAVTVRVPPVVLVRYDHGGRRTRFLQARAPEIAMPAAIDLAAVGEVGLRILGVQPAEARRFARTIDWHTTLIVPIPPTASTIRYVDVAGAHGIAVEHQPHNQSRTNTVLWSTGDRVFAMVSIQEKEQVLAMANSVR
jgi:hypothetical protein